MKYIELLDTSGSNPASTIEGDQCHSGLGSVLISCIFKQSLTKFVKKAEINLDQSTCDPSACHIRLCHIQLLRLDAGDLTGPDLDPTGCRQGGQPTIGSMNSHVPISSELQKRIAA